MVGHPSPIPVILQTLRFPRAGRSLFFLGNVPVQPFLCIAMKIIQLIFSIFWDQHKNSDELNKRAFVLAATALVSAYNAG